MDENSDMDTLVGSLTALDQDSSQKHTFKLLNSASGRFKVQGNEIKVKKVHFTSHTVKENVFAMKSYFFKIVHFVSKGCPIQQAMPEIRRLLLCFEL